MVNFAIIGTNWITEQFIDAARQVDGFELVAVYSRSSETAQQFAAKTGARLTFTSLAELALCDEVDAVYIASPNGLHAEQAALMMKAGKHVLCEKSLAANAREVEQLIEIARAENVLLMEAVKSTVMPGFLAVQQQLHKIGPVRRYVANYCQYSSRYDAFKQGTIMNAFDPQFANGSLMDIGIYGIYPLVTLFGAPNHLFATGIKLSSGVDGSGTVIAQYDELEAVVMHSKIASSPLPSEIHGEEGSIIIDKINDPHRVEVRYRNGETEVVYEETAPNTMVYEARHFIELIQAGETESSLNRLQTSLIAAQMIESARHQIGIHFPNDEKTNIC